MASTVQKKPVSKVEIKKEEIKKEIKKPESTLKVEIKKDETKKVEVKSEVKQEIKKTEVAPKVEVKKEEIKKVEVKPEIKQEIKVTPKVEVNKVEVKIGGNKMDINNLTYDKIKAVMDSKKYKFFNSKYNLNFIGVRSANPIVNDFCDYICILYTDEKNTNQIYTIPATTEPGLYWLNNPMNVSGTFILKEGQYPLMWHVGMHKGLYKALVQFNNCTGYRDSNRDDKLDLIPGTEITGNYGINFHHASSVSPSVKVDKWSAGCQVVSNVCDFNFAMNLVNKQIFYLKNDCITYTLINEKDLVG